MKRMICGFLILCIIMGMQLVSAEIPTMEVESEVVRSGTEGISLSDADYNGEVAVIVGSGGYVAVSQDLVNWTELSFSAMEDFQQIAWSDNKFILPCIGGAYLSEDGYTWEKMLFDSADAQTVTGAGFYSGDNIWNIVKSNGICIRPFNTTDIQKRYFINGLFLSFGFSSAFPDSAFSDMPVLKYAEDDVFTNAKQFRSPQCITYSDGKYHVYTCYCEERTYAGEEEMTIEIWSSADLTNWEKNVEKIMTTSINSVQMGSNGADIVYLNYKTEEGVIEMLSQNGGAFVKTGRIPQESGTEHWLVFADGTSIMFQANRISAAKPGQPYSQTQITGQDFKDPNTYWTGREWMEKRNFPYQELIWPLGTTEEQKSYLDGHTQLFWTGQDYLAYSQGFLWSKYGEQKYMYRIAEDQKTILDIYPVPGWIGSLTYSNGICTIAAGEISPNRDPSVPSRVIGVTYEDWDVYTSTDLINWTRSDLPELDGLLRTPLFTSDRGILPITETRINSTNSHIVECVKMLSYVNGEISFPIEYESLQPLNTGVCGQYYYTSEERGEGAEQETILAFSKDGVYWVGIVLPNHIGGIQTVYELDGSVIVECYNNNQVYVKYDREKLYESLESALNREQVFVQCEETILGFDTPPVTESDRTLVPMRFLFEKLGADVTWDEATQTATATIAADTNAQLQTFGTAQAKSVSVSIDNTTAVVNGQAKVMDVPARLINDKTMVPLRFLSENLGYTVTWDEATNTAIVE